MFGGTFDPVHYGHLRPIREFRSEFPGIPVRYVPLNIPPHRPAPLASAAQRLHMLQLARAEFPEIEIDTRELERSAASFTVDTLESLHADGADTVWLIVGADALLGLPQWHRFADIMTLAHIVVLHRPGSADFMPAWAAKKIARSAADLRANAGAIWPVAVTPQPISATEIRAAIASEGRRAPIGDLLPRAVWHYICEQKLYHSQRRQESNAN